MRSRPEGMRDAFALALAVLLAMGCAARPAPVVAKPVEPWPMPPPAPTPPPPPPVDPVAEAARSVIAFQARLRDFANGDLERERARLAEQPAHPENALKLAMVMARMRLPGDTARALALVDPYARSEDPAVEPWRPWLRLMAASLAEQRRLEEQIERQQQALRENQRRIEQANQKIEALKAIERSLEDRMAPTVPAPPSAARERAP
jgi:hypothetical protein